MARKFFITGTGTNVGKTLVSCILAQQLRAQNLNVQILKPLVSGVDDIRISDTALLLKAMGKTLSETHINQCSPWRFKAPLAPSMAALLEGGILDFEEIITFCQLPRPDADILLIEGAGGIMSPVTDKTHHINWIKALNIPIILVAGTYLGCISHILTAIEVCKSRQIPIAALIINQRTDSEMAPAQIIEALNTFITVPMVPLPLLNGKNQIDKWKISPNITPVIIGK